MQKAFQAVNGIEALCFAACPVLPELGGSWRQSLLGGFWPNGHMLKTQNIPCAPAWSARVFTLALARPFLRAQQRSEQTFAWGRDLLCPRKMK